MTAQLLVEVPERPAEREAGAGRDRRSRSIADEREYAAPGTWFAGDAGPVEPPDASERPGALPGAGDHLGELPVSRGTRPSAAALLRGGHTGFPIAFRRPPTIGGPDDRLEREADELADRALAPRTLIGAPAAPQGGAPPVQRLCAACAQAAAQGLRRPCPDCADEIQRRVASPGRESPLAPGLDLGAVLRSLQGRGNPLEPTVRHEFGRRLGADFAAVRIHTDPAAADAARALGAVAFTHREHVVFGAGRYDPASAAGRHLLAHELAHTIQQGAAPPLAREPVRAAAPPVQRAEDGESSPGLAMSMLASVSPGLAEIVNSGPVTWIGRKLKAALPDAVGAVVDGLGLEAPVTALRGKLERATDLVGRAAKGGADGCSAFKQILGAIHDLAAEIADSAVVKAVSAGIDKVTDVLGKLGKLVAGEVFDAIREVARPVWDTLEKIGHTVGGWITSARNALGSLWGWIADKLGFGGEGESAVWAWVKGRAKAAWQGITTALAPVVGPVTTTVKTLVAFSPLGPVYALLEYGPQIVKVVSWLWEHKDNPGYITRNAHKEMAGTFLPGLLDGVGGLREKLSGAAEWLIDRVGQIATAVLDLASTVTGLPLLSGARSVLQGAADLARAFAAAVREKMTAAVDWVTSTAKRLWDIVAPYKDVLGAIALAILNPPMIPLILAGWAWRKIPPCYKPPIVDFILDIALGAISALPGVATFGPLWALLKPGIVAFLRKLKQAEDWVKEKVSNRIANIISGASPEFLLGFVKGFLQGVWEGLTDPFKAIGTAIDALNWVRDLLLGFAARALGVPAPAPTPRISAILEGKPEGNEAGGSGAPPVDGTGGAPASGIAAGPPAPPRRLFKDEPAPDSSAPGAPVTGAPEAAPAAGRVNEPPTPSTGDPVTTPATGGPSPAPTPGSGDLGGGARAHPGNPAAETPPPMTPEPAPAAAGAGVRAGAAPPLTAAGASAATATGAQAGAGAGAPTTAPTDAPAASGSARAGADGAARPPAAASAIPPLRSSEASTPPTGGSSMVQPDIAADLQGAAEELAPPVQAAASGFWPAIKEYFASGPSASFDSLLGKLGEAWESVKGKISEAGTEVAKKVTAFFVGNQAEEQIGNATGWLAGTISFQVLLDALTAGTWTGIMGVLQQVAKFINWPMEVMGEAFKLLSKLGKYVLDGVKALRTVIKEAGSGAIRAVIEALETLAGKFSGIVERLGGRVGRTLEKRGAGALEREGGRIAGSAGQRLEEKELAKGLESGGREARQLEHGAGETERELRAAEHEPGRKPGREAAEHEPGRKPGREAAEDEPGRKPDSEPGREAAEHEAALGVARSIERPMAAAHVPVPAIVTALTALKAEFRWIEYFDAEPEANGFAINMIGSPKSRVGFVSTQTWDTGANARKLRADMEGRAGRPGTTGKFAPGEEAHHLVQSTEPRSQRARDILDYHGVDINEAANGVRLPGSLHHGHGLHSAAAQEYITFRLEQIGTQGPKLPGQIKLILGDIEDEISSGGFAKFMQQVRPMRRREFRRGLPMKSITDWVGKTR